MRKFKTRRTGTRWIVCHLNESIDSWFYFDQPELKKGNTSSIYSNNWIHIVDITCNFEIFTLFKFFYTLVAWNEVMKALRAPTWNFHKRWKMKYQYRLLKVFQESIKGEIYDSQVLLLEFRSSSLLTYWSRNLQSSLNLRVFHLQYQLVYCNLMEK